MGRNNTRGGRGREANRGGRGRGRGRSTDRTSNKNTGKTPEYKFYPHGYGRERATLGYETVKDHIIQTIQRTYKHGKDIADTIRKMEKMDFGKLAPVRAISTEADDDDREIDQKGKDMLYQAEIENYMTRKSLFEDNMHKAYSLIYSTYCSKVIQDRVTAHPEYETKIIDDPIKILEAIKILMHDPVRARYPYASLADALTTRFMTCKQYDNKSANDYMKRFKSNRDGVIQHMGKEFLEGFVVNTKEYKKAETDGDQTKMTKLKDTAFSKWIAYLFIKNSNYNKYGSLISGLTSQFSMGNDQYPRDITTDSM